MAKVAKQLKVTLIRSLSGRIKKHQATAESLGLRKIRRSVVVNNIPSVQGKLTQIAYMLNIEEV
jgi:large subunit ribosomal protein L30